jgi:hypothetical protein
MRALGQLRCDGQRETAEHRSRWPQRGISVLELDGACRVRGATCAIRIAGVPWMTGPLGITMKVAAVAFAPAGARTTVDTAGDVDALRLDMSVGVNTAVNE